LARSSRRWRLFLSLEGGAAAIAQERRDRDRRVAGRRPGDAGIEGGGPAAVVASDAAGLALLEPPELVGDGWDFTVSAARGDRRER
jgi:hypothetical protein